MGVRYYLSLPKSWIFCKPWQPSHSKRDHFWKNTPPPWNSRPWKYFVLKLQGNRFWTIVPHAFCLSVPGLLHLVLSGNSTGRATLQEGAKPGAQGNPSKGHAHTGQGTVPQHMNTTGRTRHWKKSPPRCSSREQLETRLEARLQHEWEGSTQEIGLATGYLQCKSKVQRGKQKWAERQTDQPSISQEGAKGSGLSLNGSPGPMGRECVGGGSRWGYSGPLMPISALRAWQVLGLVLGVQLRKAGSAEPQHVQ